MAKKFKVNDIIAPHNGSCLGIVMGCDKQWYYVSWVHGGDSILSIEKTDKNMEKFGEYTPGSTDDILLYGKMTTWGH